MNEIHSNARVEEFKESMSRYNKGASSAYFPESRHFHHLVAVLSRISYSLLFPSG